MASKLALHNDGGSLDLNTIVTKPLTNIDSKLAEVTKPIAWTIPPVKDIAKFEALPPGARNREIKKAADTFASTGRNVFVHYIGPILYKRKELLLASGATKKKFYKTAAQLWSTLPQDDTFYWNQVAKEIRLCMKQGILNPKGCLVHAGRLNERSQYIWHAERAVSTYLNLPMPSEAAPNAGGIVTENANESPPAFDVAASRELSESIVSLKSGDLDILTPDFKKLAVDTTPTITNVDIEVAPAEAKALGDHAEDLNLLDALPHRFEFERNMLHSHFARYDYDEVRKAEGRTQTMLLRHLAERFDKTGKELFYYYVVPRLCKQTHPPSNGDTVMSKAAELWQFMPGKGKEKWLHASAVLKGQLGDGSIVGLETLQLDSLDPEVVRLHSLAQAAIDDHEPRKQK